MQSLTRRNFLPRHLFLPMALLQFILEDLCLVCVSSYVVNGLIFVFAVRRFLAKKKTKSS